MGNIFSSIFNKSYVHYEVTEKTVPHPLVGEFLVLQDEITGNLVYAIEINLNQLNMQDQEEVERHQLFSHTNILRFEGFKKLDDNSFLALYESYEFTLEEEIRSKKAKNIKFKENEILTILQGISSALAYLQNKDLWHGQITPENIVKKGDEYKLIDPVLFDNYRTTYEDVLEKGDEDYARLLSPELLKALSEHETNPEFEKYKQDIYSLGVIILDTIVLDPFSPLPNKFELASKYSGALMDVLNKMVEEDSVLRLDAVSCSKIIENLYYGFPLGDGSDPESMTTTLKNQMKSVLPAYYDLEVANNAASGSSIVTSPLLTRKNSKAPSKNTNKDRESTPKRMGDQEENRKVDSMMPYNNDELKLPYSSSIGNEYRNHESSSGQLYNRFENDKTSPEKYGESQLYPSEFSKETFYGGVASVDFSKIQSNMRVNIHHTDPLGGGIVSQSVVAKGFDDSPIIYKNKTFQDSKNKSEKNYSPRYENEKITYDNRPEAMDIKKSYESGQSEHLSPHFPDSMAGMSKYFSKDIGNSKELEDKMNAQYSLKINKTDTFGNEELNQMRKDNLSNIGSDTKMKGEISDTYYNHHSDLLPIQSYDVHKSNHSSPVKNKEPSLPIQISPTAKGHIKSRSPSPSPYKYSEDPYTDTDVAFKYSEKAYADKTNTDSYLEHVYKKYNLPNFDAAKIEGVPKEISLPIKPSIAETNYMNLGGTYGDIISKDNVEQRKTDENKYLLSDLLKSNNLDIPSKMDYYIKDNAKINDNGLFFDTYATNSKSTEQTNTIDYASTKANEVYPLERKSPDNNRYNYDHNSVELTSKDLDGGVLRESQNYRFSEHIKDTVNLTGSISQAIYESKLDSYYSNDSKTIMSNIEKPYGDFSVRRTNLNSKETIPQLNLIGNNDSISNQKYPYYIEENYTSLSARNHRESVESSKSYSEKKNKKSNIRHAGLLFENSRQIGKEDDTMAAYKRLEEIEALINRVDQLAQKPLPYSSTIILFIFLLLKFVAAPSKHYQTSSNQPATAAGAKMNNKVPSGGPSVFDATNTTQSFKVDEIYTPNNPSLFNSLYNSKESYMEAPQPQNDRASFRNSIYNSFGKFKPSARNGPVYSGLENIRNEMKHSFLSEVGDFIEKRLTSSKKGQSQRQATLQKEFGRIDLTESNDYIKNSAFGAEPNGLIKLVLPPRESIIQAGLQERLDSNRERNTARIITKISEDGSKYEGEMQGNLRHGQGKLTDIDGFIYEGSWKLDRMDGYGVLYSPNNKIIYEGEWKNNRQEGSGVMYNQNIAHMVESYLKIPFDKNDNTWVRYEGEFKDSKWHGFGKLTFSNNDFYQGMFRRDVMHGKGSYSIDEKTIVAGEWNNNVLVSML